MLLPINSKATAYYSDRDYHSDNTKNNRLSIQLRLDGFSFAQIDSLTSKLIQLEDFDVPLMLGDESVFQNEKITLRLEAYLKDNPIYTAAVQSVDVVLDNCLFTLVPEQLFDPNQQEDYLKFAHQLPENHIVKNNFVAKLGIQNIFAIYAPLYFLLSDHFKSYRLLHLSTVFIQQTFLFQQTQKEATVYVEIGNGSMLIVAFDGNRLVYSNSFKFKEKEDFIYFILLVYNQLYFSPEKTPLYFSGNINRSSPLYAIAYQYIGKLEFLNAKSNRVAFGNDIPDKVGTQYFNLIQAFLCE
ncbi:MAG TPA: hypothetical protein DCG69_05900 [Bacteroidales bacterium]|nr:hypothetical protein [Bacteroidales bacterium]